MANADLDKQPDSVSSVLKVFGILQALGEEREIGSGPMPRGETSTPGRCQSVLDKKLFIFTAARGSCQVDMEFSLFRGPVPSVARTSSPGAKEGLRTERTPAPEHDIFPLRKGRLFSYMSCPWGGRPPFRLAGRCAPGLNLRRSRCTTRRCDATIRRGRGASGFYGGFMESKLSRALAPKRPDAPTLTSRQLVKAWWQALRPPFFIVDLIPVGLGGALAARDLGYWPWGIFAVVMVGCFCLHTVANIANDLFDYLEGVDTDETIGGTKVIQNGWISPRQISLTIMGLLLATVLIGWWLIWHSGQGWLWGPVAFAVFSAVFYVAPPIRYGCRGYGELFVCLNMGFIMVMGSYAVMAGGFSVQSLALALPVGLMVAGILYYQSLPEIETDLAAGKRTLANILGKAKAELVFKLWWPAVWVLMANLWACGLVGWPVFIGLLTFPLYWRACRLIHEAVEWLDLDRHGHLVRKLYLINGALLIAGVVWK